MKTHILRLAFVLIVLISSAFVQLELEDDNPYNGYIDWNGRWIPGVPANESWFLPSPEYQILTGNLVYYAPYLMESTAEYRDLDLTNFIDGVSLLSCADIGKTVWLSIDGAQTWEGPYLNVDCAGRTDIYATTYYNGEVIEVGFKTARRLGLVDIVDGRWVPLGWRLDDVRIIIGDLPISTGEEIHYPAWWLNRLELTPKWERDPLGYINPTHWRFPNGEVRNFLDSDFSRLLQVSGIK